jgi:hypothetical protein
MKWSGCLNHNLTHATSVVPTHSPTPLWLWAQQISGWGCILMTPSRTPWNTLYMYKVDLIWVWSGWVVLIITYSTLQVRNRVNCLLPTTATVTVQQISGWSHILMTPSHSSRRGNTLYMYGVDLPWVWSVWGVLIIIITYNLQHIASEKPSKSPTPTTKHILGWCCIVMTPSHNRRYWSTLYMMK